MTTLVVFPIAACPANAQPAEAEASCQAALSALAAQWYAIDFEPPSKPAQAIVAGRDHVVSGGQYNAMITYIRAAHQACGRGDSDTAIQDIATVKTILNSTVHQHA
jgi:hypothetical protein